MPAGKQWLQPDRRPCCSRKDTMKKEELGKLILASEDSMYRVAKTLLCNDADCGDAIQEAIVKAFTNLHTLKKDSYAKTWLIRIVINECYAIMRRQKRLVSLEDYRQEEGMWPEDYSGLYEALAALPQENRICVTLYYLEGYSVRETAKLLGITESAVKNRLMRARAKLRSELEDRSHMRTTHVLRSCGRA